MFYSDSFPEDFPFKNILLGLFFVDVTAGKHVRVWKGSHSALLHRSRPLLSAHSASVASLTREAAHNVPHIFHHLGVGSDLLKVPSNSRCKILLFWSTRKKKPHCAFVSVGKRVYQGSMLLFLFCVALLLAFVVVAPVPDTERECVQSAWSWKQGDCKIHVIQVEQTKIELDNL